MDPLEIVVTADTRDVTKGSQDTIAAIDKIASSANQASSSFQRSGQLISKNFQEVSKRSYTAMQSVQSMGDVIRDIPWAASNPAILTTELTHVVDNFGRLKNEAGGSKSALEQITATLKGGGGLILAFNLVALAVGYLAPKLLSLGGATKELSNANKEAVKAYDSIIASESKESTEVAILVTQLQSGILSRNETAGAIKKLQQLAPEYFSNLNKEHLNINTLTNDYNLYTASILKAIEAKSREKQLEDVTDQILKLQDKGKKSSEETVDANGKIVRSNIHRMQSQEDLIESLKKSETSYEAFTAKTSGLSGLTLKEQRDLANLLETRATLVSELAKIAPKPVDLHGGNGKKDNPYEDALKALEDYYNKVQALRVKDLDANLTDSAKNTTAVNDILLKDQIDFLEKKLALQKKYGKEEGQTLKEIALANQKVVQNAFNFTQQQTNTLQKPQNAPGINFAKITAQKIDTKPVFEYSDAIKKNIKLQQDQLALMYETENALNKTVGPAFDQLFQDILSGSTNAFRAFGKAIEQVIVQLAAAVLKAALFAAILSVINPASTAATGTGGFGNIFKRLMGFSNGGEVKGYADGGAIQGPGTSTSDSILARVSRGEFIMNAASVSKFGTDFFSTLNRGSLPKFSTGGLVGTPSISSTGSLVFIPSITLKGQDLLIAFNRASQRASRNG